MSDQFLLGALFGLLVAIISYAARFLTKSGALATFVLAVVIYGIGAWELTAPIVTFFATSSILSKMGKTKKLEFNQMFEKSGTRDWAQVFANGGVAGGLALLSAFFTVQQLYPLYLGAIAAAAADTWGTEIGVLARGRVISIVSFSPVPAGTSGGISLFGTLGGALGAMTVAVSGYAWYGEIRTALIVAIAGIAGSLADSLLGATLQARFRCSVCGAETERTEHCGQEAEINGGVYWIRNDVVNVSCTLVGAIVACLLM
jgi:uncharacterized protein (TIGR00297 family)